MNHHTRIWVAFALPILAGLAGCDQPASPGGTASRPDRVAPQPVGDLALSYSAAANEVAFTWTAPADDPRHDRAAGYRIRYAYAAPFDWEHAIEAVAPPAPLAAGMTQEFALAEPARGRDLYAAIRAFDAAGNESPAGNVAQARVPGINLDILCVDGENGLPVAGLDVLVASQVSFRLTSGADGRVALADIPSGMMGLVIQTGSAGALYHRYQKPSQLSADGSMVIPAIRFAAAELPPYGSTLEILRSALITSGPEPILKRWAAYPIPWNAPAFVNAAGIDYLDLARRAAARWNERTGLPIFVEVASPPASGVRMAFLPPAVMGIQNGVTEYTSDADGYPLLDTVKIVDTFSDSSRLYAVMMHELGHTIRLGHLPNGFIMYAAQPLPSDISDDEARVVRLMVGLPNGTDLEPYELATGGP